MELTDQDKKVLNDVHTVFYKARLIDSPELANLGLMFTQLMQRVMGPKPPMVQNAPPKEEKKK